MNTNVSSVGHDSEVSGRSLHVPSTIPTQYSWETLNSASDVFLKSLKFGRIRGLVSIVCGSMDIHENDFEYKELTRELISRDILVTLSCEGTADIKKEGIMGQAIFQNAGDGLAEFCDFMGIPPVLYMDGTIYKSGVFDFFSGLARHADVNISDLPAAALSSDRYSESTVSPGPVFTMKDEPERTADLIDGYIHEKRVAANWCDRCGGHFSAFS